MKVAHDENQNTDGTATWYHVDCFADKRSELGWFESESAEKLPGFRRLKDEDKETVKSQIP